MDIKLSEQALSGLSELIAVQMGLQFPIEQRSKLERGISAAATELGFEDAESCARWLLATSLTQGQIEILAKHLTIGETYFFRDKKIYTILRDSIFPKLIKNRQDRGRCIKIWSAGCSSGEEPFSIAILLSRLIPEIEKWQITIMGTDINRCALQKASEGIYTEWSFRDTEQWVKQGYFTSKKEGKFEILPHIKKMVKFFYLNLAEDNYTNILKEGNTIDLIICRNVLMYFSSKAKEQVIKGFKQYLTDRGLLILSPNDSSQTLDLNFTKIKFSGSIIYKKESFTNNEVKLKLKPKTEVNLKVTPINPSVEYQPYKLSSPANKNMELLKVLDPSYLMMEKGSKTNELLATSKEPARLAREYADQGKIFEALKWCDQAIEVDKINPGIHYLRATILQETGRLEEAADSLRRAIYLDPNFIMAHFILGNLTRLQGKIKESEKYFNNARTLLENIDEDVIFPESEGIAAQRLLEIIETLCIGKGG